MNLNIHNVSLSIKGRLIVDDVTITVNPGEVVGLMGPNGAGKTTTFNLAVGNIKPDKGEVLINDKNIFIKEVSKKAYRSRLIVLDIVISLINLPNIGRRIQDQSLNQSWF